MIDRVRALRGRAAIVRQVREFFWQRDYLEVDTPLASPGVIPESSLHYFRTELENPDGSRRPLVLLPSPELWMKRLLAEGQGDMFQICKSFRNREEPSRLHQPEFTMLEWYTTDADYLSSIETTEDLFRHLGCESFSRDMSPPFRRLSIHEAFADCGIRELDGAARREDMIELSRRHDAGGEDDDSWEVAFNRMFLSIVEPCLPMDRPLVLYDYPKKIRCLARSKPSSPWSERWELYVRGVELANCYSEEENPRQVRTYYEEEARELERQERELPVDACPTSDGSPLYPPCSGAAMGLDRLIMLLLGAESIGEVISFTLG